MKSEVVPSNQKFHCGRFDAYQHNGRIALEFMAGGDEEQYVDFKPEEAKAFYEWLAKVLAVETSREQRFYCPVEGCPGHPESFHMCPRASQYLSVSPEEAVTYATAAAQEARKRLDATWPNDSLMIRLERSVRFLIARLNFEMQRKGEPLRTSSPEEPTPKLEPPTQEWLDRSQGLEPEETPDG